MTDSSLTAWAWWTALLSLVVSLVTFVVAFALWKRQRLVQNTIGQLSGAAAATGAHGAQSDDPTRLLARPPMVPMAEGNVATRDWITHYSHGQVTWAEVITDFYGRAAEVPQVLAYFPMGVTAQLKRHFTQVMIQITHKGITVADRETLIKAHAEVRNSNGDPITVEIYDMVISTLVAVLVDAGVPMVAIQDLGRMLAQAELRTALTHSLVDSTP